jgi:hypothetical protein
LTPRPVGSPIHDPKRSDNVRESFSPQERTRTCGATALLTHTLNNLDVHALHRGGEERCDHTPALSRCSNSRGRTRGLRDTTGFVERKIHGFERKKERNATRTTAHYLCAWRTRPKGNPHWGKANEGARGELALSLVIVRDIRLHPVQRPRTVPHGQRRPRSRRESTLRDGL